MAEGLCCKEWKGEHGVAKARLALVAWVGPVGGAKATESDLKGMRGGVEVSDLGQRALMAIIHLVAICASLLMQ